MHFLSSDTLDTWLAFVENARALKMCVLIASCLVSINQSARAIPDENLSDKIRRTADPANPSLSLSLSDRQLLSRRDASHARPHVIALVMQLVMQMNFRGVRPPLSVPIVSAHHRSRVEEGSRIKGPLNRVARAWLLRGTSPAGVGFFV